MSFWNCYQGKKVLLTRHTGFKGSWLAIWLKELGAEVYGYALAPLSDLDNFVTCNLAQKINHYEGDVRDAARLKAYFQKVQQTSLFIWLHSPWYCYLIKNPQELLKQT